MTDLTVVKDLNGGLRGCLEEDPTVYLWGEDILSPYGGAFKVTKGLSDQFPDRVLTTPISEASIVGMGVGAALRGLKPVVEIMFGDFLCLAADQLVNHAAKFAGMYNGQVRVPLVVRTPMGGGRGYGPTHSQSLEKHVLGVPGLRVVAPSHFSASGELLKRAVLEDPMPVVFVEHKLLYPMTVRTAGTERLSVSLVEVPGTVYPTTRVTNYPPGARPDVTLLSYGGTARPLESALEHLHAEEIWVDTYLPVDLSRLSFEAIEQSCRATGRLLIVEEGAGGFGYGAGAAASIAQNLCGNITLQIRTLTSAESVIPCEKGMESDMLVSTTDIVDHVLNLLS